MRGIAILPVALAVLLLPVAPAQETTRIMPYAADDGHGALADAALRLVTRPCIAADPGSPGDGVGFCFVAHDGVNRLHVALDDVSGQRVGGFVTFAPRSGQTFCPCDVGEFCGEGDFVFDAHDWGDQIFFEVRLDGLPPDGCAHATLGTATVTLG